MTGYYYNECSYLTYLNSAFALRLPPEYRKRVFNRPGVAGAVLQTASSFIE